MGTYVHYDYKGPKEILINTVLWPICICFMFSLRSAQELLNLQSLTGTDAE